MKLVSVWIENYMNIHNLGFNLGDDVYFNYFFDEDLRSLTIESEKTNEYFDLFKNSTIRNITGVLGNNGSGKTNFLKFLNVVESKKPITYSAVLIFKDENTGKYIAYNYTNFFEKKKILLAKKDSTNNPIINLEFKESDDPFFDVNILFYSNLYSDHNDNYLKESNDLNRSVDYISRNSLEYNRVDEYNKIFGSNTIDTINIGLQYNVLKLYFEEKLKRLLNFIALIQTEHQELKKIINTIPFPEYLTMNFKESLFEDVNYVINHSQYKFERINDLINYCWELITNEKNIYIRFQKELVFKLFLYAFKDDLFKQTTPDTSIKELEEFVLSIKLDNKIFDEINIYMESKKAISMFFQISKLNKILNRLRKSDYKILLHEEILFTLSSYNIKVTNEIWPFIKDINELFKTDNEPLISFRWHSLSAGQEAILNQFSELWLGLGNVYKKNLIVSIDEGELYLHPEWQRQYIGLLNDFLEYSSKINPVIENIQLLITSHSPFIASDIPKFNLIFLKRDEPSEENSRPNVHVVSSQNHQGTFGGNIFDLYKNSFFIKDFFGTYSSKWINEAFNKINNKESLFDNEIEISSFLQIIGEKVVKEILQNQLQNKNDDNYEIINLTEKAKENLRNFIENKGKNNPTKDKR